VLVVFFLAHNFTLDLSRKNFTLEFLLFCAFRLLCIFVSSFFLTLVRIVLTFIAHIH